MMIIGYHGTVEPVSRLLDDSGKLKAKKLHPRSLPGDLGTGTYFFKDNPLLAREFTEKINPSGTVSVIMGTIEVAKEEVLDLNDPATLSRFNEFKNSLLDQTKKTFRSLRGGRNCIDGIVINIMVRLIKETDQTNIKLVIGDTYTQTKKYSFEKNGRDIYFISNFANGTELCVRDTSIVKEGVYCHEL